jgi:hypothetical protein
MSDFPLCQSYSGRNEKNSLTLPLILQRRLEYSEGRANDPPLKAKGRRFAVCSGPSRLSLLLVQLAVFIEKKKQEIRAFFYVVHPILIYCKS